MSPSSPGGGKTGWATMRPALLGAVLLADAFVVAALGIARPAGWVPPFVVFGGLLIGFVGLELWAIRHRHDDDGTHRRTEPR